MTPTGFGPAPVPYLGPLTPGPGPGPDRRDRDAYAWVVPVVVSALLTALVPTALLIGFVSKVFTNDCATHGCSAEFTQRLDVIDAVVLYGGLVTLLAYAACWALPWRRSWTVVRIVAGVAAVLPPVALLGLVLTMLEG
jgi:hypothetical protein